jgi:hypothetical protein
MDASHHSMHKFYASDFSAKKMHIALALERQFFHHAARGGNASH